MLVHENSASRARVMCVGECCARIDARSFENLVLLRYIPYCLASEYLFFHVVYKNNNDHEAIRCILSSLDT